MNKGIEYHRAMLKQYIEALKLIPEDSILAQLCLKSCIAHEKRMIEKLRK